jgi:hypothetical protein
MTAPGVWTFEAPSPAHLTSRNYVVPVEVIGSMRPVMKHGANLENRHRRKPPSPLSLHRENRR